MSRTTSIDEVDDAATVVGMSRHDTMVESGLSPSSEKNATADKAGQVDGPPPEALDDQTNFLPTRQVIMVFMGLSIALACSMLDQTM